MADQYTLSDPQDKKRIREQQEVIEDMQNFIEYLFEHSEHCDHILQSEAWEEFRQWEKNNS